MKSYCTNCGAELTTQFCTSCGAKSSRPVAWPVEAAANSGESRHSASAANSSTPPPPRPSSQPRSFVCVRCGSAIDSGLTCKACSSTASIPTAAAKTDRDQQKAAPGWTNARGVGVAAWIVAMAIGVLYYTGKSGGSPTAAMPFGFGRADTDGSYLWSSPQAGSWIRLTLHGDNAQMQHSSGVHGAGKFVRSGKTLKMLQGVVYVPGEAPINSDSPASEADLFTIVDDGQALYSEALGIKLVKQ